MIPSGNHLREPLRADGLGALLERGTDAPLHLQIRRILEQRILDHTLTTGDRLPPEGDLTREFRVSRMTVRQALASLENEGLIYRRHGKGTFVGAPRLTRQFSKLSGFSEDVLASGNTPGAKTLAIGEVRAPEIASALADNAGQVLLVHRLRTINGQPAAAQRSYLASALVPGLDANVPFESLYAVLRTRFGLVLDRAEQMIEARSARADEIRLLEVPARSPVVEVTRTTYLDDGRPLEVVRMVYRADFFQFRMTIGRHERNGLGLSLVLGKNSK